MELLASVPELLFNYCDDKNDRADERANRHTDNSKT